MHTPQLTQTLEILDRLIGFDTTSSKSNLDLIDYVERYLDGYGVSSRRFPSPCGTKANLLATIGSKQGGGIIWSGHTDVVPVEGQSWNTAPYKMTHADPNHIVGRGVTDMKGFLACCLALVPRLVAETPATPIHLCFSYDEEVGCLGVRSVIHELANWPTKPKGCIVGEPTNCRIVTGHKTKRSLRVRVTGTTAHSSLAPQAVNAVHYASRLITQIADIAEQLERDGEQDTMFSVPHTTAHVGLIHGGTQLNIVPSDCYFDFEFRVLPQLDADAQVRRVVEAAGKLTAKMKQKSDLAGIEFESLAAFPGLDMSSQDPWVTTMMGVAGVNDVEKVAYGAEAGLFQMSAGIPTVICGPGTIEDAHKPNERLDIQQLVSCLRILERSAYSNHYLGVR